MKKNITNQLLSLPDELLINVLIFLPNLLFYKKVNKRIYRIIEYIKFKYSDLIKNISHSSEEEINNLMNDLFVRNKINEIIFLYNNFKNSRSYIHFYIGYYNVTELLLLGLVNDYQEFANGAAKAGNLDLVKYAISMGAGDINNIVFHAAMSAHIDIVKYGIAHNFVDFLSLVAFAAQSGDWNILTLAIKRGKESESLEEQLKFWDFKDLEEAAFETAKFGYFNLIENMVKLHIISNFTRLADYAALGGYINIVQYCIDRGANNIQSICEHAAIGEKLHVIDYLKQNNIIDWNGISFIAAKLNKLKSVIYAFSNGAINTNEIALISITNGNMDILKYLLDNGANNLNSYALSALMHLKLNMVIYLIERGANNYEILCRHSVIFNHIDIVKYILDRFVFDIQNVLVNICAFNRIEILKYIIENKSFDKNKILEFLYENDFDLRKLEEI